MAQGLHFNHFLIKTQFLEAAELCKDDHFVTNAVKKTSHLFCNSLSFSFFFFSVSLYCSDADKFMFNCLGLFKKGAKQSDDIGCIY